MARSKKVSLPKEEPQPQLVQQYKYIIQCVNGHNIPTDCGVVLDPPPTSCSKCGGQIFNIAREECGVGQ